MFFIAFRLFYFYLEESNGLSENSRLSILTMKPSFLKKLTRNLQFCNLEYHGRVEVVKASLDLTGKILILIKEDLESWMSATERSATPLYTEKSSWYCSLNAWKVQF